MTNMLSPLVRELSPYVPGEQVSGGGWIKLNTNENPYPPSPKVNVTLKNFDATSLKLYPDPCSIALREKVAGYHGVGVDNVFVGNGSDEVLAHAFQAFFCHAAPLLFPDITYSFYTVYCRLFNISYKQLPLSDSFAIDEKDYLESVDAAGVIFPNPNAPTGRLLNLDAIAKIADSHSKRVVLVDEAYIDFAGKDSVTPSAIQLIDQYPNIVVTRTLSKSRSLAGLRLGYAIANEQLIDGLVRVKDSFNSYPIDSLASELAIASFDDEDYLREKVQQIAASRQWLVKALQSLDFNVLPSQANFLFVEHSKISAESIFAQLKAQKILVRYFNKPRISNYLRITIGTQAECESLVSALKLQLSES